MIHFLGIGAQKAGTTWLHHLLNLHPDISFPAGKEVHFWDRCPAGSADDYLVRFRPCRENLRQGEITPAYALLNTDSIRRIHAMAPQLRLLFVLRNPIDRAWSSALMAVQRAEMQPHEASDHWFLDHFRSAGSLGRGDYESTLQRWHSVFAREQLLALRFEDIAHRPRQLLSRCATHLGVDPEPFARLPESVLRQRVFVGPQVELRPALRAELARIYLPRIASLQNYLGWNLAQWLEASACGTDIEVKHE
jgi:hypothetical protein